ncbi:MAG: hypothetical protein Q9M48_08320 [Rhodobacterales bacterium]|nr:hypothetical protein [Rhodobacterales bacterium]
MTGYDIRHDIATAQRDLENARQLNEAATLAVNRASTALEHAFEGCSKAAINALPVCETPVTDHRKLHRSGRPAKIDLDPELQAFIRARIDRLTYLEKANAVADYFPAKRRVSKSSIRAWWQRKQNG